MGNRIVHSKQYQKFQDGFFEETFLRVERQSARRRRLGFTGQKQDQSLPHGGIVNTSQPTLSEQGKSQRVSLEGTYSPSQGPILQVRTEDLIDTLGRLTHHIKSHYDHLATENPIDKYGGTSSGQQKTRMQRGQVK